MDAPRQTESAQDVRIRSQYSEGEGATGVMFDAEPKAPREYALQKDGKGNWNILAQTPSGRWSRDLHPQGVEFATRQEASKYVVERLGGSVGKQLPRRSDIEEGGVSTSHAVSAGKPTILDRVIARGDSSFEHLQQKWAGRVTSGIDPADMPHLVNIGAAMLARGVRTLKDFTARMVNVAGESVRPHILKIWKASRQDWQKWQALEKENATAARAVGAVEIPQAEGTKQTVRRMTGQVDARKAIGEIALLRSTMTKAQQASREGYKAGFEAGIAKAITPSEEGVKSRILRTTGQKDMSGTVSEAQALRGSMAKAQAASESGYRSAVETLGGLKRELTRIVRENLPREVQGKMLGDVSKISTMGQMRLAIAKASKILADVEVGNALRDVETLTGTPNDRHLSGDCDTLLVSSCTTCLATCGIVADATPRAPSVANARYAVCDLRL